METMLRKPELNKCLIIEDEPMAIEMMRHYIGRRDDLKLIGVVSELQELNQALEKLTPSIIFLDLMISPGIPEKFHYSNLPRSASIIVVSAIPLRYYSGTLPKGKLFELPKPFSFENFDRCVNEVLSTRNKDQRETAN